MSGQAYRPGEYKREPRNKPSHLWCCDCMSVSNFICWSSNSQCDGTWRKGLWEVITSWRWRPHDAFSAFIRRDMKEMMSFSVMGEHSQKVPIHQPKRELSPGTQSHWHPDLGCLTSRTVKNKHLLFQSPSLWVQQPKLRHRVQWFVTSGPRPSNKERTVFLTVLGNLDVHNAKQSSWTLTLNHTQNKLKINWGFQLNSWNHKTLRGKHWGKSSWCWIWQGFPKCDTKSTDIKIQNR